MVDRNPDALKLAEQIGANDTVVADGGQVDAVKDLTGGGAAPTWCSTSSPSRAPSRTGSR